MKKLLGITLGIMTALGGFVDLGQIVFTMQAGALFRYRLLWVIALGTFAIILYMEMCGRIAVVAKEPVFAVVRTRLGFHWGLAVLIASNLLNLLTCAAELGGVAILLRLLTGVSERYLLVAATGVCLLFLLVMRFQWIERIFGLAGLLMIAFAVSAVTAHPRWEELARGFLPTVDTDRPLLFSYFAVGIFSALLMAYEVHFYSSGAIEEDWTTKDLGENFAVASLGSTLGAILTAALLVLGALVLAPRGIFPNTLSAALLTGAAPLSSTALLVAILGSLACVGGAAVETALSGAYNLCQFFRFHWGKNLPPRRAPAFTGTWIAMFVGAMLISLSGVKPLTLVNLSIVFGMVVLPFTYYPILAVAADRRIMGRHVNSRSITAIGIAALILICLAAASAIPLMVFTHSGQP